MFDFLKKFGKKEKEVEMPYEFVLVNYTKEAKNYGVFEDFTTEIRHYRGLNWISYYFNKHLLSSMQKMGIPIKDLRRKEVEMPIQRVINPQVLAYQEINDE